MEKLNFTSDYMQGCDPAILKKLMETNYEATAGYGDDPYTASAADKIRSACNAPDAVVKILTGGTQTNQVMIDVLLRSYEGVIAADTGHIALHEAGAIEFTGHKVLTVKEHNGKVTAEEVRTWMEKFLHDDNHEHMVQPGLVYISQPSEYGTLYSLQELKDLNAVCHQYHLHLYADGARLAYALASEKNDVTLADLAEYCDAFYIGGTKCGALYGEAVVVKDPNLIPHFLTSIKQHGALLAKGRIAGIQFDVLFERNRYLEIGRNAVQYAMEITDALKQKGIPLAFETETNQIFPIFEDSMLSKFKESVNCSFWEKNDADHTTVRLAACWATTENEVQQLIQIIKNL